MKKKIGAGRETNKEANNQTGKEAETLLTVSSISISDHIGPEIVQLTH